MDQPVKKGSGSWSLVRGSVGEESIWVMELGSWIGRGRKDMGHRSLVHGSAGEEVIWVRELGSWIGR